MKLFDVSKTNITSICDFTANRATFPALQQIHGYWDGLCNGSLVPYRSDVDPRALEAALEFTFILERVAPGVCRFRIAGHHLNDLLGMDVRGMPITAMFLPEARGEISRLVESVCAEPGVQEISLKSPKGIGRGELVGKILLTPLLDSEGQVTRILGGVQTNGTSGRAPRRFAITSSRRLQADRAEPNAYTTNGPDRMPIGDVSETAPARQREGTHFKEAPALKLVINNS